MVIDLDQLDPDFLPDELAVSALTMAELAAGPHAAGDSAERVRRQDLLQRAEATFHPLPFDSAAARAYGHIYAAIMATGRKARGPRAVDLLIAATAMATELPPTPATPTISGASSIWSRSLGSDPWGWSRINNIGA